MTEIETGEYDNGLWWMTTKNDDHVEVCPGKEVLELDAEAAFLDREEVKLLIERLQNFVDSVQSSLEEQIKVGEKVLQDYPVTLGKLSED